MNLIKPRLSNQVDCIYIDPPYNTVVSSIPYKNDYKHSTFATLINDRCTLLRPLLSQDGVLFVSIDKNERTTVEFALDNAFGIDNRVEELIWVQNTNDGTSPTYSTNHEYIKVYAKNRPSTEINPRIFREPKPGFAEVMELVQKLSPSHPSIIEIEKQLKALYKNHLSEYRQQLDAQGLEWKEEKKNNPWNGIYQYKFAEYRDSNGRFVKENEAKAKNANIWDSEKATGRLCLQTINSLKPQKTLKT